MKNSTEIIHVIEKILSYHAADFTGRMWACEEEKEREKVRYRGSFEYKKYQTIVELRVGTYVSINS